MPSTLAPARHRVQYAPVPPAQDGKIGPAGHILRDFGYSDTPGGAVSKLRRHEQYLRAGVAILAQQGQSAWANGFLLKLDLARLGLFHVELSDQGIVTIETRDAADDVSRLRWHLDRTPTNAAAALRDARRMIEALQELIAGILTHHPELR